MRFLCLLLITFLTHFVIAQDARWIVKTANDKMRGTTLQTTIRIRTIRPAWNREMQIKAWTKGTHLTMILVESPAKEKGIVFLKRQKEVWNWLPALEKNIKLPPSMMSQSWMGTDFTNDDLVKESSVVDDYEHTIIGDTMIDQRDCYIIQMIPKPEVAVVWSKLIICIDKKDFMELHTRFYDEEGILINSMNAYDIKWMDQRLIPTRFEMIPANKKGQKTEMIYLQMKYNQPIDDRFFSLINMKTLQ